MNTVIFEVRIALIGPVFTAAQGGRQFGLDSAMLRDWNGQPALPGALVRGNLRHSWAELKEYLAIDCDHWLGAAGNSEQGDTHRSAMRFSHWFTANLQGDVQRKRPRIRIGDSGTVEDHMLQFIEAPFDSGETVVFSGEIQAQLRPQDCAQEMANLIQKGLSWIPALGAFKGIGFGRLKQVEVTWRNKKTHRLNTTTVERFGIQMQFDRPICFAKPQTGKTHNNLFESESYVPGAAILAVLSKDWPEDLREAFNAIHISHALPSTSANQRPVPIPMSLVAADNGFYDVAGHCEALIRGRAPAFQLDWKSAQYKAASEYYPWPELRHLLETRTKIEITLNRSEESQLFAQDLLDTREQTWLANIDLSGVPPEHLARIREALLQRLAYGLAPLGKTDAHAEVTITEPHQLTVSDALLPSDTEQTVTLTLITDALLLDPIPEATSIQNTDDWRAAYSNRISAMSESSLSVTQVFTKEKLVGGPFLHHHFGRGKAYQPKLLTTAGSVLVLQVHQLEKALSCLKQWQRTGLPAAGDQRWQSNPYLPQNGYGEVAILQKIEEFC